MERLVGPVEGYEDTLLAEIRALDSKCAAAYLFLFRQLRTQDPDPDDFCGEIARTRSIYTVPLPDCRRWHLAVSLLSDGTGDCLIHGLVSATDTPCQSAYQRVAAQLLLQNQPWDPRR